MKRFLFVVLASAMAAVHAQHGGYAGQQSREIKALSAFPGPLHVLEVADKLGLSGEQLATTKELMDQHKRQARAIGAHLVDAERALEALFKKSSPDQAALARAVREVAALEGEYRLSHLETHRRMRALLTEDQVERYDALRGYSAEAPAHRHRD